MSEALRLFFALWPDSEVQARLAHLGRALAGPCRGRPVPVSNLHLTLAFLGNIAEELLPCIEEVGDGLCGTPFRLYLDHLGFFPRAGVVWAGCSQVPEALIRLQSDLSQGLIRCGLQSESRPFRPHLTLLRKAWHGPGAVPMSPVGWAVGEFVLVASAINNEGSAYTVRRRWPLASGALEWS